VCAAADNELPISKQIKSSRTIRLDATSSDLESIPAVTGYGQLLVCLSCNYRPRNYMLSNVSSPRDDNRRSELVTCSLQLESIEEITCKRTYSCTSTGLSYCTRVRELFPPLMRKHVARKIRERNSSTDQEEFKDTSIVSFSHQAIARIWDSFGKNCVYCLRL